MAIVGQQLPLITTGTTQELATLMTLIILVMEHGIMEIIQKTV